MARWYPFAGPSCFAFRMTSRGRVATLSFRVAAWIAGVALAFAALAPTLVQAVAAGTDRGAPWAEICTTAAMQPSANPTSGGETPAPHGIKHCPWCAGSSQSCVLASASYTPQVGSGTEESPIYLRHHPAVRLILRGSSQPRAPPTYS